VELLTVLDHAVLDGRGSLNTIGRDLSRGGDLGSRGRLVALNADADPVALPERTAVFANGGVLGEELGER